MYKSILALALVMVISGCNNQEDASPKATQQAATEQQTAVTLPYELHQTIFFGGDILTMNGDKPEYAEAVVEREGKIIFVGTKAEAFKRFEGKAELHDLKGNTLMPGFVEPHLHPSIAAIMLPNEVIAPHDWVLPDGVKKGVKTPEAYIKRLGQSIKDNAKADKMYFVWGYHQLWHGELNRDILNKLSPDKPVAVIHRSFHEIFLNDKAIEMFGIKESDFKGNPQVNWKEGHFYEGGWLALVPKISSFLLAPESYKLGLAKMTQLIQKNGITTIAEPGFPSSDFKMEYGLLKNEMDKKPPYDVYLIPNGTQIFLMAGNDNKKAMEVMETLPANYNTENIEFLPKQVKLYADGAIYSLLMQMEDGYPDGHTGEWMTPLDLLKEQLSMYWNNDYKIHVHANGDLGIQQVMDFNELDQKAYPRKDHRFTLHHMGYFTDEQADEMKRLGMEASVNPFYLWALADKYAENGLGAERANSLVSVKKLVDRDIPVSFHSDFAMAPVEPLTLAWTAVNRVTAENRKVSQDQRIDAYTAMKAITITAARTLNLETKIGSIKEGKAANFTVLKSNPLKIDTMKIKDIVILGTVFHGKIHVNKSANLKR